MNYQELKAAVSLYVHRKDLEPAFPVIMELATNRIGRDTTLMELENNGTFYPDIEGEPIPLPTNYMRMVTVATNSPHGKVSLEYFPPNQFSNLVMTGGRAYAYTIINNEIVTKPAASTLTLVWLEKPARLENNADTNIILTNWFNLYFYGFLVETYVFLQNAPALEAALQIYMAEVKACNKQADAARHSGAPLVMRGPS